MTNTKGSSLIIFSILIKEKFGDSAYNEWLNNLSEEARKVFSGIILATNWYPVKIGLIEPTLLLSRMFYSGDTNACCTDLGIKSAEHTVKGIFRMFLKIGSPEFLLGKAGLIFSNVYDPCRIEVKDVEKGRTKIVVSLFEDMHEVIELRLRAIFARTAEFIGCKNVKVEIVKSMAKGQSETEFLITWD